MRTTLVLMHEHLQAIVTVLSLVNPTICAAMFSNIEAGRSPRAQLADATKASIAVLVILLLAAMFGVQALHQFGVSLDAFKVAGGGVLAWMGFAMLAGKSTDLPAPDATQRDPSLTPLILFGASPGAITGVITIAVDHSKFEIPVTAILAIGVAAIVLWSVMVAAARFGGLGGHGFLSDTVSRLMGLIVIAMGVQFVLTGIQSVFNATGTL